MQDNTQILYTSFICAKKLFEGEKTLLDSFSRCAQKMICAFNQLDFINGSWFDKDWIKSLLIADNFITKNK